MEMKLESWLLPIVHRDEILIRTDLEHLLQTSVLKISGHISVTLLPVGWSTFFKQMVDERLLVLGNHFHMLCIWFSDGAHIWWSTHHIRSSKPNCKAGVQTSIYFSRRLRIYCAACIFLAELDHLKEQIDIERDAALITLDLEDDTVMSYCM